MAKEIKKDKEKEDESNQPERRISRLEDVNARDVLNRLIDEDFWLEPFGAWRFPKLLSQIDRRWFPKVDISETDKEIKVVADVPGVDTNDISIDVRDNRLSIHGKSEQETETEKGARPYRYERSYGEFRRDIMLPSRVKENEIRATCKDGVLTITLPKVQEDKARKVKIEKE